MVVAVVVPSAVWSSEVTTVPLGLGSLVPAGTKPTVISWFELKRSVPGRRTAVGLALGVKALAQY